MFTATNETKLFLLKPSMEGFCSKTYDNIIDAMYAAKKVSLEKMKNVVVYKKQKLNSYIQMGIVKFINANIFDFLCRKTRVKSTPEFCETDIKQEKTVDDEEYELEPTLKFEEWSD